MKILIKAADLRVSGESANDLAISLFNRINADYLDQTADGEVYLLNPKDKSDTAAEDMFLIDGKEKPEEIVKEALDWNKGLEDAFSKALEAVQADVKNTLGAWLNAKYTNIYRLKKAVMALDDDFYEFAESAVLIDDHVGLRCRITEEQLNDIKAHPDDYAIVHVWPK